MLKGFWGNILVSTLIVLSLGACKEDILLDPSLSPKEREVVLSDLQNLKQIKIDPKKSLWFKEVFLSTAPEAEQSVASSVQTYLLERIHHVLPEQMIVEGRFRLPEEVSQKLNASSGFVIANNVGTSLFYQVRMMGKPYGLFSIAGKEIPVRSTRVGLVQLGAGFTESKTPAGTPIDSLFRIGTLVHEARHSDCSDGLSEQSIQESRARKSLTDKTCGHIHSACPAGHTYEGRLSCEDHPWGAYAVEAVFLQSVAEGCSRCTAQQKETAKLLALDRLSRLDPELAQKMFAGKLGAPKMNAPPEDLSDPAGSNRTQK